MKIVAIIPARGGSKGIPGKNIRMVAGKPLLVWSIEHARQCVLISRVIVSTDSEEIAGVARLHGAEVIMRPAELSGDTASSESGLLHALDFLRTHEGYEPDLVVFLQATSPIREPDDIWRAIGTLRSEHSDSLFSACRVEGFVWRMGEDQVPRSFTYDHLNRPRRQDAPEDLLENGSIYVFKPWVLRQFNNRLGGKISVHRMPSLNSFQIDELADIELIEALQARRRGVSETATNDIVKSREIGLAFVELQPLRLLVLDFDGVLTDNRVVVSEQGTESVICDRGDGFGIALLKAAGVEVLVLSKEQNPVVQARCRKLAIECVQGCDNKLSRLQQLCAERGLDCAEVGFVGNDLNDLECLRWVGVSIAVADSVPELLDIVKWRTRSLGGRGAVREVCDRIILARGKNA